MSFEIREVMPVSFVHVQARPEYHGDERVRAVDIRVLHKGDNNLLDVLKPGLRAHHFHNKAAEVGQQTLPDALSPLPDLRHPELPTKYNFAKGEHWRGYTFVRDFGIGGPSNLQLDDCVVTNIVYEIFQGGATHLWYTVQYNGKNLADDALHGRITGMASEGEGHVQLLAPAGVKPVKGKNWRSGEPDAPPPTDKGAPLLDQQPQQPAPGSPEAALADSVNAELDAGPGADPFAAAAPGEKRKRKEGAAA